MHPDVCPGFPLKTSHLRSRTSTHVARAQLATALRPWRACMHPVPTIGLPDLCGRTSFASISNRTRPFGTWRLRVTPCCRRGNGADEIQSVFRDGGKNTATHSRSQRKRGARGGRQKKKGQPTTARAPRRKPVHLQFLLCSLLFELH